MIDALAAVHRAFRSEYGRTVAILMRSIGDLDAAEDAVQDAFTAAADVWPAQGVPPNPQAWIVTTARRRAIDRIRRTQTEQRYAPHIARPSVAAPEGTGDDELRMILLCAHPSLSPETQVALTLRYVGGLTATEIARAFGSTEATIAQRLSRAKRKIKDARIDLPGSGRIHDQLGVVLAVIYAIYNEGYVTTSGPLSRFDLSQEGVRLARLVVAHSKGALEAKGLLALLVLLQARRPARIAGNGSLIPLPEQDRRLWDRDMIAEGQTLVRECLTADKPGQYQLQAAIQAVHCDASRDADTDWRQILALYDMLLPLVPTAAVRTARIVALSHVESVETALEQIAPESGDHYELAVRADLLARLGDAANARVAFQRAASIAENTAERTHLLRRADELT
ncbi:MULTISPECIES: RNA polymerase sigma factor [Brachybacterium]|uniref:Sigma-70 family RNA polymerase sigma factor n=1 Tax=Brachybacterium kimchii TaxID=2942909 RepID=A0ABY4N7T0_9MICO|nr:MULTISPECIES: sigma-70 family RNA polymerase sigma factor [Brachybacterium]MCG7308032.1 sigma-70 family RNA polymerase sigma factor [Brachybacterium sp. ACRRE]UQN30602.1 sigma-70 family RNA polymerase sigma factor [Brachybacterium kimchii]